MVLLNCFEFHFTELMVGNFFFLCKQTKKCTHAEWACAERERDSNREIHNYVTSRVYTTTKKKTDCKWRQDLVDLLYPRAHSQALVKGRRKIQSGGGGGGAQHLFIISFLFLSFNLTNTTTTAATTHTHTHTHTHTRKTNSF